MDAKASKQCEGCVELAAKVAELEKQLVAIQDQLAKANKTRPRRPSHRPATLPIRRPNEASQDGLENPRSADSPVTNGMNGSRLLTSKSTSFWSIATTVALAVEARWQMPGPSPRNIKVSN